VATHVITYTNDRRRRLALAKQNEIRSGEQPEKQAEITTSGESAGSGKKLFVEPEISVPIDVLEATTFFQVVESGATG
jgi:hypothetical protein